MGRPGPIAVANANVPKRCPKCGSTKATSHFGFDKRTRDSLKCWCRACKRIEASARWRAMKPEMKAYQNAAMQKSRGSSPRNFIAVLRRQGGAKHRHGRGGLSLTYLLEIYQRQGGLCPYSGIPMTWATGRGRVDTNISIDRLDVSRGYEEGNVVLCCYFINVSKREKSIDEWLHWAEAVWQHRSRQPLLRSVS
jgi:hypothetical protein